MVCSSCIVQMMTRPTSTKVCKIIIKMQYEFISEQSNYFLHLFTVYNIFFFMHTLLSICFIVLARKWSKFIGSWQNIEISFNEVQIYDIKVQSLKRYLTASCYLFLFVFLTFFGLIQLQAFFELTAVCHEEQATKLELMLRSAFPDFYFLFGYHIISGFIVMVLFVNMMFARSFNDFFIMILSKLLSRKFEVFNEKLLLNISVSVIGFFVLIPP